MKRIISWIAAIGALFAGLGSACAYIAPTFDIDISGKIADRNTGAAITNIRIELLDGTNGLANDTADVQYYFYEYCSDELTNHTLTLQASDISAKQYRAQSINFTMKKIPFKTNIDFYMDKKTNTEK